MKTRHLLLLATVLATAHAASFRKGPYLVYPGKNTAMTIMWQADATPRASFVEWGTTPDYGHRSGPLEENGSGKDDHLFAYTITGLEPGKLYNYRVVVDSAGESGAFRTGPPASAQAVTFYAYGDTRSAPQRHDKVCAAILADMRKDPARRQTLIVHTGDWAIRSTEALWQREVFDRKQRNIRDLMRLLSLTGCAGNHENTVGDYSVFAKYLPFGRSRTQFDYGPVHFLMLTRDDVDKSHEKKYAALERDMAASANKRWKIAVIHHPAYTAGSGHRGDKTVLSGLCPLLVKYRYDVVISGHNHLYARAFKDGVTHITTGGGGAPLHKPGRKSQCVVRAESVHHFLRFDVAPDAMTITAIRVDGSIIESVRLEKGAAGPPSAAKVSGSRVQPRRPVSRAGAK